MIDTDTLEQVKKNLQWPYQLRKERETQTARRTEGRWNAEDCFVMYRFLKSHVAVSSGCMCERALCLQPRFLGSANQMD